MYMFYFVFEVEKRDVVESLYVFFQEIAGEVLDVLKYFSFQFLDGFVNVVVLLGDVGLEEETDHARLKAAQVVVVSDSVLEFAADSAQLFFQLGVDGVKVSLEIIDQCF